MSIRALWALAPVGASACGSSLEPDQTDPTQYALGSPVVYKCGAWSPAPPAVEVGLFDIYFSTGVGSGGPPADADTRQVTAAGGTIVRLFQVDGLRAIIPVSAVPRLEVQAAVGVTVPSILEHPVGVGFHVFGKDAVLLQAGGRIIWAARTIPDFFAVVPDTGISLLRKDPELRYLELSLAGCGGFEG